MGDKLTSNFSIFVSVIYKCPINSYKMQLFQTLKTYRVNRGVNHYFFGTSFFKVALFDCNFDQDLCGWTQSKTDKFDWSRWKGLTNTPLTGPHFDHTSKGNFISLKERTFSCE